MERLRQSGLKLEADEEDLSGYSDKLKGMSIVISGVFARHSRDEYKALIENMEEKCRQYIEKDIFHFGWRQYGTK